MIGPENEKNYNHSNHEPQYKYRVWKDYVEEALSNNETDKVLSLVIPYHHADIADLLESLHPDLREKAFHIIATNQDGEFIGDLLSHISKDVRQKLIHHLSTQTISKIIQVLESDDAIDILSCLPKEQCALILMDLPDSQKALLEGVLFYPAHSAARLMQRELAIVPIHFTVAQALEFLKTQDNLPEKFYDLFVVDTRMSPVGTIRLQTLFKNDLNAPLDSLMQRDVHALPATMDQEVVAQLFKQYGLISAPVVDEYNRIIGMITLDNILEIIEEEVQEDIMKLGRVSELDINAGILETVRWRFKWLMVTFFSTLIASTVIYQFQDVIEKIVALAILMPIVVAMGGNAGMQVVTVTVRAIATQQLKWTNLAVHCLKEVRIALINGLFFSIILALVSYAYFRNVYLAIVLVCALLFNICWAGFAGFLLPVIIHRFKMDPAISAGPILTTTTDVFGFLIFLGLAKLFLLP